MQPDDRSERFCALHAAAAPRLWSWAALHVGPALRGKVDPEDLLQEVAARAWRRFDEFDPARGSFFGWSLGIARRVLAEALARLAAGGFEGRRAPAAGGSDAWSEVPDDATRATARLAREDALQAFLAWAETLERDERRLLLYRGLEGASHAEVAALLGLSEAAVSKRWDRLRERLRAHPRVLALLDG